MALLLGAPLLGFVFSPGPVTAALLLAVSGFGVAYQLGLARRFLTAVPEANRGQAFGLALTGTMTLQGLFAAGGGALGEVAAPGLVVGAAGAASLLAVLSLRDAVAVGGRVDCHPYPNPAPVDRIVDPPHSARHRRSIGRDYYLQPKQHGQRGQPSF